MIKQIRREASMRLESVSCQAKHKKSTAKALDTVKKAAASGLRKDEVKRVEKEVEELTKKFVKSADDMCKSKENEITTQA
ncbi:hypothetical protein Bca101_021462 [Brassica carinata]